MIPIDKGIPVPNIKKRGKGVPAGTGRCSLYPWDTMEIGDSFLFPLRIGESAYSMAAQASQRYEKRFSVVKTPEGWRCWRTA